MSHESALSEYEKLVKQSTFARNRKSTQQAMKRQSRILELWPLVQEECRASHRVWVVQNSKPDDRLRGLELVHRLATRLRKYGYDQKAGDLLQSLFCGELADVPCLLDRLQLAQPGSDDHIEWKGIQDSITEFLAANQKDVEGFIRELENRLSDIEPGTGKRRTKDRQKNPTQIKKEKDLLTILKQYEKWQASERRNSQKPKLKLSPEDWLENRKVWTNKTEALFAQYADPDLDDANEIKRIIRYAQKIKIETKKRAIQEKT